MLSALFSQDGRNDRVLLTAMMALLALSVLMVFSTTAVFSQEMYGDEAAMIKRHVLHVILGLLVFYISLQVDTCKLEKFSVPLLFIVLAMLLLVVIPGVGHAAGGARRWFVMGPLRIQPGELAKLAMIIYMSSYIGRHYMTMGHFIPGVGKPLAIMCSYAALLLLEPDFGTTVVIATVVFFQLLTVTRIRYLIGLGVLGLCSVAALIITSPYRMKRLLSFIDPFADPNSSGYQLIQSLIAVGSGGVSGTGLGAGGQKLYYLPAAHTDFIFAVIAEELGLIGALTVVLLFFIIGVRGLHIAKKLSHDPFRCSLALGCTLLIVIPAFLNMGVVTGLLPTKGLVLPLVASGGTAMLVHLAIMGILVRLSRVSSSE